MRIHHLNCGSLCPRGGALFGGTGPVWSPARMCCHCLLIEGEDGLILVDSGLGVDDVADPSRLGFIFHAAMRPKLEVAETALRQIADLGFRVADVRHIVPTHLDLDHAGGLADFPDASVHVFAPELDAAQNPRFRDRLRYRPAQLAGVAKWAPAKEAGETWFGFESVRALPGTRDDVLLIPLPGHSRGHCGVAVASSGGWLLHCGDAYFHRDEIETGATPAGLAFFEASIAFDNRARLANQNRLRELKRDFGREVRLFSSHDPEEFAAMTAPATQAARAPFEAMRRGATRFPGRGVP